MILVDIKSQIPSHNLIYYDIYFDTIDKFKIFKSIPKLNYGNDIGIEWNSKNKRFTFILMERLLIIYQEFQESLKYHFNDEIFFTFKYVNINSYDILGTNNIVNYLKVSQLSTITNITIITHKNINYTNNIKYFIYNNTFKNINIKEKFV